MYDPVTRTSLADYTQRSASQPPAPGPASTAHPSVRTPLDRLRAAAIQRIDAHTNDNGRCRLCRCPFPCTHARQAEFTLGAL